MNKETKSIPRFAPNRAFPAYAFVPGVSAHPIRDPQGHSYGRIEEDLEAPDPNHWDSNEDYLYGIDLFNHGFYWEAHETWEDIWNADGRIGPVSDFIKGLIKLAAAGVKTREGIPRGVIALANGACNLFRDVRSSSGPSGDLFMGFSLHELIDVSRSLARRTSAVQLDKETCPISFDILLIPLIRK